MRTVAELPVVPAEAASAEIAGDMLTLSLREHGLIAWGAADKNEKPPAQEPILKFLKHLNSVRRKWPEFLRRGRMLKPVRKVVAEPYRLCLANGKVMEVPGVFQSRWRAADGREATFLTNFLPREQTVAIDGETLLLPPLTAVKLDEGAPKKRK